MTWGCLAHDGCTINTLKSLSAPPMSLVRFLLLSQNHDQSTKKGAHIYWELAFQPTLASVSSAREPVCLCRWGAFSLQAPRVIRSSLINSSQWCRMNDGCINPRLSHSGSDFSGAVALENHSSGCTRTNHFHSRLQPGMYWRAKINGSHSQPFHRAEMKFYSGWMPTYWNQRKRGGKNRKNAWMSTAKS